MPKYRFHYKITLVTAKRLTQTLPCTNELVREVALFQHIMEPGFFHRIHKEYFEDRRGSMSGLAHHIPGAFLLFPYVRTPPLQTVTCHAITREITRTSI